MRIRNCTGARVLVVTSVDGVNVISGDTASPSQSGYVLEPWGSVEIAGWRKNMERTAAFYFTDLGDSYAARTGTAGQCRRDRRRGVPGKGLAHHLARSQRLPRSPRQRGRSRRLGARRRVARAPGLAADAGLRAAPARRPTQESAATAQRKDEAADGPRRQEAKEGVAEKRLMGKLGTGHGRNEQSRVTLTKFERASESPAETIAIQYDRRENLIAMGVLPAPRLAHRDPDPFPAPLRFAPDPYR